MTVLEAFRNRALWVPERENPIYRVEYISDGHSSRVIISVEAPETAKEELQKQWEAFAQDKRVPEACIREIICIGNKYENYK